MVKIDLGKDEFRDLFLYSAGNTNNGNQPGGLTPGEVGSRLKNGKESLVKEISNEHFSVPAEPSGKKEDTGVLVPVKKEVMDSANKNLVNPNDKERVAPPPFISIPEPKPGEQKLIMTKKSEKFTVGGYLPKLKIKDFFSSIKEKLANIKKKNMERKMKKEAARLQKIEDAKEEVESYKKEQEFLEDM